MTPQARIIVNGAEMAGMDRLVSVRTVDAAGLENDSCEITLDDAGNDIALPPLEAAIEVSLGYAETGGPVLIGRYVVDAISGSDDGGWAMTVTGRAADLTKGLKQQRRKSWPEGATISSVFSAIAGREGLKASVDGAIGGQPLPRDFAVQRNESDLQFLTRIGRRLDALVKVAGGALICARKGSGKAPSGASLPEIVIQSGEHSRIQYSLKGRPKHGKVEAEWRDRGEAKAKTVSASAGDGEGPVQRLPTLYSSEREAKAAAEAQARDLARAEVSVSITLPGRPEAQAEAPIRLEGFREPISRARSIARVEHEFSKQGFTTVIEAEPKTS